MARGKKHQNQTKPKGQETARKEVVPEARRRVRQNSRLLDLPLELLRMIVNEYILDNRPDVVWIYTPIEWRKQNNRWHINIGAPHITPGREPELQYNTPALVCQSLYSCYEGEIRQWRRERRIFSFNIALNHVDRIASRWPALISDSYKPKHITDIAEIPCVRLVVEVAFYELWNDYSLPLELNNLISQIHNFENVQQIELIFIVEANNSRPPHQRFRERVFGEFEGRIREIKDDVQVLRKLWKTNISILKVGEDGRLYTSRWRNLTLPLYVMERERRGNEWVTTKDPAQHPDDWTLDEEIRDLALRAGGWKCRNGTFAATS